MDQIDIAELRDELEKLHSASFGWALNCCRRDHAEAEEVLQTVYLKIFEGKARYRGEASLKTWLFAVIRKTAIGEYRKRVLRNLVFLGSSETPTEGPAVTDAPTVVFEKSETGEAFSRRAAEVAAATTRSTASGFLPGLDAARSGRRDGNFHRQCTTALRTRQEALASVVERNGS
jgi:RNA polymerase sigma factor (sigma-70 family)